MFIAAGKIHVHMQLCFDYCTSQSLPQLLNWIQPQVSRKAKRWFFFNFDHKTVGHVKGIAFPENRKACSVHYCYHRMIHTSNTLVSYMKYQSHTGQLSLLSQRQHRNCNIFTLVNREKTFPGLCRFDLRVVCILLQCFFFQKTAKSYDSYAQTYTHGHTLVHTYKQKHKSLWPPSLPSSPAALDQASFLQLQNTEKWLWSHVALFSSSLSHFKPQNTTEKAASFWQTLLGVHLLTC